MRILVTGASGFVGRAVCARLAARGDVTVLAGGRTPPADLPPGVEAHRLGEIGPDTDWAGRLDGVDVVIHLAARVHVMDDTAADPLAAFRAVNTEGSRRLAEAAAAAGVRRLVYASSVKAMGERTGAQPFTEGTPAQPEDPYGLSKLEAERDLAAVSARTGLEVAVVRPPLVYGPGVKGNMARLLSACARGLPLPLGCARNRRSLVSLGNLASALEACALHPAAAGRTFLVRDGEDLSSADLVRRLCRAMGRSPRLLPVPVALLRLAGAATGRTGAVSRLVESLQVDDGALRAVLGWRPEEDVDQALSAMAAWYLAERGGPAKSWR